MASNQEFRNQNGRNTENDRMNPSDEKQQTVQQMNSKPPRLLSRIADTSEVSTILANGLYTGNNRTPDFTIAYQPTVDDLGLEPTERNIEFCKRQRWMVHLSVDEDGNFKAEGFQIKVTGDAKEFQRTYEDLLGHQIFSKGNIGTYSIGLNDTDTYNNVELDNRTGIALSKSVKEVDVSLSKDYFHQMKVEKLGMDKPTIHLEILNTSKNNGQYSREINGYITNVHGGPTQIETTTAEIFMYADRNSIGAIQGRLREEGKSVDYLSQQVGSISAFEATKAAIDVVRSANCDTSVFNAPSTKPIIVDGYLRPECSTATKAYQEAVNENIKAYKETKSLVIQHTVNQERYNPSDIISVKENVQSTCDRVHATDAYTEASNENVRKFTTVLAEERIKECDAKEIELTKSYSPTKELDRFIVQEIKAEQEGTIKYNASLQQFNKLELLPIQDSKNADRTISDRFAVLKELGFADPEKLPSMSKEEVLIQMENLQRTLIKVSPSDEASLSNEDNMKRAENISRTLACLHEIVESHPDNFKQEYKEIHLHGSHDRLPVSLGTVDAIETLQTGKSTIPQIKDITIDDLSSKEKCVALRAELQRVIDEKTHFIEHDNEGAISRRATHQAIMESIDVKSSFTDENGKFDISKITPESLKAFSEKTAEQFSPSEKITVDEVVRLRLCQEIISQQEHSMDYKLDSKFVDAMRDEATKSEVLKYMGEHHDEIRGVLLAAHESGLSREETLASIEKHLSLNCNVTAEDMNRIRDVNNDFFKQELFQEVMYNGAPEGTKFVSITSMLGVRTPAEIENLATSPEACAKAYAKMEEMAEYLEGVTTARNGTSKFIDQGQLSFVTHMRDNMAAHIAENNLEQAQSQKINYQYDAQIYLQVKYTQQEISTLERNETILSKDFKENSSDIYAVYQESHRLSESLEKLQSTQKDAQERVATLKSEKETIETKIEELTHRAESEDVSKELIDATRRLSDIERALPIQEGIVSQTSEEIQKTEEVIKLLDSKVNNKEFKYESETASQKEQLSIISEKEEMIQYIIDNYKERTKIETLIDSYQNSHKDSQLFNEDQTGFIEGIKAIDWSEYQKDSEGNAPKTYTPLSQLDMPLDSETCKSPIKLEIMSQIASEKNGDLALLMQPEIDEYIRQGDRTISQKIFTENMTQAYVNNPQVDISVFQEYQKTEMSRIATESAQELVSISTDKKGESTYSWNIENCTEREILKTVSTEELTAARAAELEKATAEIKSIIYGSENSQEPSMSQITEQLRTINPTAYGTQSIEDMIDTRATTSSTIYHLEQQLEDTRYQKFAFDISKMRELQDDLTTMYGVQSEIDSRRAQIEALQLEDDAKSSWARRLQGNNEREISAIQSEISGYEERLEKIAQKYEVETKDLEEHIKSEIKSLTDYESKLDSLVESYTSKINEKLSELNSSLERVEDSQKEQISDKIAALESLSQKPLSTWTKEDSELYTKEVDSRLSVKTEIVSDIQIAHDYHTYVLQAELLESLQKLESTREAYQFTAHEIQQNNYVLVGHEMDSRSVYSDYETRQALRTVLSGQELSDEEAVKLGDKYHKVETMHEIIKGEPVKEDSLKDMSTSELKVLVDFMKEKIDSHAELEKDTEKTIRFNAENGEEKQTLSAAIRLQQLHESYESVVNAYNESLSQNFAIHVSNAKAEAFEAEAREQLSDKMFGQSEQGVITTIPEPITPEPLSPAFHDYISQMEGTDIYKVVMQELAGEKANGYDRITDKTEDASTHLTPETEKDKTKDPKANENDEDYENEAPNAGPSPMSL